MWHLSTIHHVDAGAVSSVQGLAPTSLEVHFDPGAKGRRRSGLHPSRAPRSAHHSTTGTEEDVAQRDAVEDSAEVALPKHPRSFALEGAGSAGISAGASSSSSNSCDGGGRQSRLGRQMLGRLWILMQEMMDMAWQCMARVVILFEVQDRALLALLLKQSKLWRTYMVRVNSRKSRTFWVTLGNFGHCTVFIGRLSEHSNLPSTPKSFTCDFFL